MNTQDLARKFIMGVATILTLGVSISANAATISYTAWSQSGSDTVIPIFTVSDDPAGMFQVDVSIDMANSPNDFAQVTGIYFDLGDDIIIEADITGESLGGPLIEHTDFATNASKINGVTNLNLGNFEVVLGYKDGNNRAEIPIMFFVSDHGGALTLADWGRVGLRFQGVGESAFGAGSDKETSSVSTVVPIPTAAWLFGCALLGLVSITRCQ